MLSMRTFAIQKIMKIWTFAKKAPHKKDTFTANAEEQELFQQCEAPTIAGKYHKALDPLHQN